jgi:hypothetical protein
MFFSDTKHSVQKAAAYINRRIWPKLGFFDFAIPFCGYSMYNKQKAKGEVCYGDTCDNDRQYQNDSTGQWICGSVRWKTCALFFRTGTHGNWRKSYGPSAGARSGCGS